MFSVNALLYGNYPDLAQRCLSSIVTSCMSDPHVLVRDVRIGLNDVSPQVLDLVRLLLKPLARRVRVRLYHEASFRNVLKYPLMRRMFHMSPVSEDQPYTVWFDDDSYIKPDAVNFWLQLKIKLPAADCVFGSVYLPKYRWTDREIANIMKQPWYGGVALDTRPQFATGGFWVASTSLLRKWDYPFPALRHNGGDVLLGEFCRQQRVELRHWQDRPVAINADARGRESKAGRRGITTERGFNGDIGDMSHHEFDLCVETLDGD